jgi:hypothetical protein
VPVSAAGALDERNVVASPSKPVPAKNEAGLNETKIEKEEKRETDATKERQNTAGAAGGV